MEWSYKLSDQFWLVPSSTVFASQTQEKEAHRVSFTCHTHQSKVPKPEDAGPSASSFSTLARRVVDERDLPPDN